MIPRLLRKVNGHPGSVTMVTINSLGCIRLTACFPIVSSAAAEVRLFARN